jgi:antitoxin PrlF
MPTNFIKAESTLTDRYQTTIPDTVRKALQLNKRDRIHYVIQANGQVIMTKATQSEDDPLLGEFLSFLAQDIKDNPHHIQAFSSDLLNRLQSLIADVEFDIDAPLSDEDE